MRFFIILLLSLIPMTNLSYGQSLNRFTDSLMEMNRIHPLQRPDYDRLEEILKRRILDNKNKVVGEITGMRLTENGNIAYLSVDFNRLRLGPAVSLNYHDMRIQPVSRGYALRINDNQIEGLYPELLASVETAAGQDSDTLNLKSLIETSVVSEDGRTLGTIRDVLFSGGGDRAEALYLGMTYKTLRGQGIAVPFRTGKFEQRNNRRVLTVSNDQADTMIDFTKNRY